MKDYTVKTVFVGMDVHKNTYSVTAICDKVIIKRDTLCKEKTRISNQIKSLLFLHGLIPAHDKKME